jgi:hypothetical protein
MTQTAAPEAGALDLQESAKPVASSIEPLMSIMDLAGVLKCSRRGVERLRASGRVPKPDITVGRMPRWRPGTIRKWIEKGGRA